MMQEKLHQIPACMRQKTQQKYLFSISRLLALTLVKSSTEVAQLNVCALSARVFGMLTYCLSLCCSRLIVGVFSLATAFN